MVRRVIQNHTRELKPTLPRPNPLPPIIQKQVVQIAKREHPPLPPIIQKRVVQTAKREKPKLPIFSSPNLSNQIRSFTQQPDKDYYLGFGGLGDALLLMAACWGNPRAKVVFFANQIPFINNFFDILGISVFLHSNIMGTKMANHIFDYMKKLPTFKESAHLADELNYNDWSNERKYISRIRSRVNWIQHFGKNETDKPVIVIGPSGSNKDIKRQRYLHNEEYRKLVNIYLDKDYKVYATGSMNDLHHFGLVDRDNYFWLNSDGIYDSKGIGKESNLKDMLRIINSAEHVFSMDTWLKTYTLLCGIPTTVIGTRWDGKYRKYGEDITDYIFLNRNIWPNLNLAEIETLL